MAHVRGIEGDPRRAGVGRGKGPTPLEDTGDAVLEHPVGGERVVDDPDARPVGDEILGIAISRIEREARRWRHPPRSQQRAAGEPVDPISRGIYDPQVVAPHRHPLRATDIPRRPLAEERAGVGVDEHVPARVDDPLRGPCGIRRDPDGPPGAEDVAAERRAIGGVLIGRAIRAVGHVKLRRRSGHGERHGDRRRQEHAVGRAVGEAVVPDESGVRGVTERPVRIEDQLAAGRSGHEHGSERVAIDVPVVDQDTRGRDGEHPVLGSGIGVRG